MSLWEKEGKIVQSQKLGICSSRRASSWPEIEHSRRCAIRRLRDLFSSSRYLSVIRRNSRGNGICWRWGWGWPKSPKIESGDWSLPVVCSSLFLLFFLLFYPHFCFCFERSFRSRGNINIVRVRLYR